MLDTGAATPRPPSQGPPKSNKSNANSSTVHDDHLIQAKIKLAGEDSNPMQEATSAKASPSKKRKSGIFKPDIPTAPIADLDSDISSSEEQ